MPSHAHKITAIDGHRDGPDHGPDHGQPETAHCRRCDADVRPDAGRCPECRSFLPGNPGGEVIKRDRRAALRESMATLEVDLTEDLGGADEVTAAQRILIKQATHTAALASALLAATVKAGPGSEAGQKTAHTYLSVLDRQHRALAALGIERRTADADPYLVIQEAVEAANRDHKGDQDAGESQPTDNGGGPTPEPDDDGREAAPQALDSGNPPADVMGKILQAAGVPS